jgi:hypothetical protein
MTMSNNNPFEVVKATDFSNAQIEDYWVDLPGGESLLEQVKPTSPMPMFVLGGKGSGKTHLMRFISSALQKRRAVDRSFLQQVKNDGYLGVYSRCGGLNASRFAEKGQPTSTWLEAFAYYMELWLGQVLLEVVQSLLRDFERRCDIEPLLVKRVRDLCDTEELAGAKTLEDLCGSLQRLQHKADHAINNCAITNELALRIHITRGRMIFGLPKLLSEVVPDLASVQFLYLFDEFENLSSDQQRYVNTLIREKEPPCSLKIGARLYGIRTHATLSGNEVNREGAEFEVLKIDDVFRARKTYGVFATQLVTRRLQQAGFAQGHSSDIGRFFEIRDDKNLSRLESERIRKRYENGARPYMTKLRGHLLEGLTANATPGVSSRETIDRILQNLENTDFPFLEKTATFLLYRYWSKGKNLAAASESIRLACMAYRTGARKDNEIHKILRHFKSDIIAQLRRETGQRQDYLGLQNFITMSSGLPRYLLTTLKHTYKWSVFTTRALFAKASFLDALRTEES